MLLIKRVAIRQVWQLVSDQCFKMQATAVTRCPTQFTVTVRSLADLSKGTEWLMVHLCR